MKRKSPCSLDSVSGKWVGLGGERETGSENTQFKLGAHYSGPSFVSASRVSRGKSPAFSPVNNFSGYFTYNLLLENKIQLGKFRDVIGFIKQFMS